MFLSKAISKKGRHFVYDSISIDQITSSVDKRRLY
jgi:hypothetical protein